MLENIATNIAKAGSDNKEELNSIGSRIENGQTKISSSIDAAAEVLHNLKDEMKANGEMLESNLGNLEEKLGFVEIVATNIKNFDASSKEALNMIVSNIQDLNKEIGNNILAVKDEIGVVGKNIEDSKDSIDNVVDILTALDSLVNFVEDYSETLTSIDENTKINLENLIKSVEDSSLVSKEGLGAIAGNLMGELEGQELNFVESLLEIAGNLKESADNVKNSGLDNKVSNELIAESLVNSGQLNSESLNTIKDVLSENLENWNLNIEKGI